MKKSSGRSYPGFRAVSFLLHWLILMVCGCGGYFHRGSLEQCHGNIKETGYDGATNILVCKST